MSDQRPIFNVFSVLGGSDFELIPVSEFVDTTSILLSAPPGPVEIEMLDREIDPSGGALELVKDSGEEEGDEDEEEGEGVPWDLGATLEETGRSAFEKNKPARKADTLRAKVGREKEKREKEKEKEKEKAALTKGAEVEELSGGVAGQPTGEVTPSKLPFSSQPAMKRKAEEME